MLTERAVVNWGSRKGGGGGVGWILWGVVWSRVWIC